jgi:hypothetical protein
MEMGRQEGRNKPWPAQGRHAAPVADHLTQFNLPSTVPEREACGRKSLIYMLARGCVSRQCIDASAGPPQRCNVPKLQ